MERLSNAIIKNRKSVFLVFLIICVISAISSLFVAVNYNMVDYLPPDAQSTTAIQIMESEYGAEIPNVRIMLTDVSIQDALDYKEKFSRLDGVTSITWLDDIIGLATLKTTPLEILDPSLLTSYYKDKHALMSLSIETGQEKSTVDELYKLIGENSAAAGEAFNTAEAQRASVSEVVNAMAILLPIIIIILIIATTSWVEPLLFLLTIGVAVIINMGTNIIFGEVSFITKTVSPILQLAVSLDYAIFLLHSFNHQRAEHEPREAMRLAMKQALPTVAASAATTIIGFAALTFMRFGIGADLGLSLLKGIIFSFISVMVFLPAVTLMFSKIIDRTKHRRLLPDFQKTGNWLLKIRIPLLLLALLLVIPCFLAQYNTQFLYGMGGMGETSRLGRDTAAIEKQFGRENTLVLLVPKENIGKEYELSKELADLTHVTGVVSFVTAVGAEIPAEFVPKEAVKHFYSENYSRLIINTDTAEEGTAAFDTVQTVSDTAARYYGTYYLAGQSATLYDMKNVVADDVKLVNLLAIIGIFIVLLLTFRSLSLPLFLLFSIETAIWINLSFPYFTGQPLSFIGYLIISTVQLGATVDYAILFTHQFLHNRKTLPKKEAMRVTIGDNLGAILISAGILAIAGFTLALTSINPIISELGLLLGRGAMLAFTMVAGVLPALLVLFDKTVQKTTLNHQFHNHKS